MKVDETFAGETIEQKMRRIVNNNQPIKDSAPIIYTERREGVKPEYNIRTDIWETAVEQMDKVTNAHVNDREQRIGEKTYDTMTDDQKAEFNKKYPKNKYAREAPKNEGEA